jgi:hypothetical protein
MAAAFKATVLFGFYVAIRPCVTDIMLYNRGHTEANVSVERVL